MITRVMLDLETFGTRPGSAIVSIGAVKFGDGKIIGEFYQRIDLKSCVDCGLVIDPDTVLWWLKQSDEARLELTLPSQHIAAVLQQFAIWIGPVETEVWGNGAAFDNALLAEAYHALQLRMPWRYSKDRCYRTLKNLHPEIVMERNGTHHHALDDARSQAHHLMRILK
jgi:DNA polymerase III epsilon subunit-like protein